jgi:cell division transport system permease protein
VAVLFLITNTIKLAIYSRRNEIEIYKLVGATDWYVKAPFLIEGAIQGVLGALIALGILSVIHLLVSFKAIQVFGLPFMDFMFLTQSHALGILSLGLVPGHPPLSVAGRLPFLGFLFLCFLLQSRTSGDRSGRQKTTN